MKKKVSVLGRGLSSILNDPSNNSLKISEKSNPNYSKISLKKISLNPNQPRTNFNNENLNELVQSIKSVGLIQPITVRKISKNEFQLISGERRFRAFKKLNIGRIPAYIRDVNDQESLEMSLIENIQRDDLDSIDIAIWNLFLNFVHKRTLPKPLEVICQNCFLLQHLQMQPRSGIYHFV